MTHSYLSPMSLTSFPRSLSHNSSCKSSHQVQADHDLQKVSSHSFSWYLLSQSLSFADSFYGIWFFHTANTLVQDLSTFCLEYCNIHCIGKNSVLSLWWQCCEDHSSKPFCCIALAMSAIPHWFLLNKYKRSSHSRPLLAYPQLLYCPLHNRLVTVLKLTPASDQSMMPVSFFPFKLSVKYPLCFLPCCSLCLGKFFVNICIYISLSFFKSLLDQDACKKLDSILAEPWPLSIVIISLIGSL